MFEYDPDKSRTNLAKHGITFSAAEELWGDHRRIVVKARTEDEDRWLVIGEIDGRVWTAVITHREARVRIISVRRSREKEVALYEG